jgi:hypothetical protein
VKAGIYVYGIVDGGVLSAPPQRTGVDPEHETSLFDANGLTAVVSEVDVTEFEGAALERNVARPDWLEAKVRGHESVLDEIVGATTVVPMRFGSIFSSHDGLLSMLADNADALEQSLKRVRHRTEWGVKVHCDDRALIRRLTGVVSGEPSGKAYLMRKKAQLQAEATAADTAARLGTEAHVVLATIADEAVTLGSRGREGQSAIVLNGAYLVHDSRRDEFMNQVEDLQEAHADAYVFEVTGPWPPYNFTSADVAGPRS